MSDILLCRCDIHYQRHEHDQTDADIYVKAGMTLMRTWRVWVCPQSTHRLGITLMTLGVSTTLLYDWLS